MSHAAYSYCGKPRIAGIGQGGVPGTLECSASNDVVYDVLLIEKYIKPIYYNTDI